MEQKYYWITITTLGVLVISGCVLQQIKHEGQTINSTTPTGSEFVTAKLISITNFTPCGSYYEGTLILSDTATGEKYSIFVCSKSWDWVKKGSCYKFSPDDINENVEHHKYSAELSGCYVGTLEQVSC